MKRILTLCIAATIVACKGEPKDYATLSGKIENFDDSKTITIFNAKTYTKIIQLNDDGTFKDTLKIEEGNYNFQHGQQHGRIFLKNGDDITFETDYKNFPESMVFKGEGSDINNLSLKSALISKDFFTDELVSSGSKEEFDKAIEDYKSAYNELKNKYKNVDSSHVAMMDKNINTTVQQLTNFMSRKFATLSAFPKGSASPTFENYENYAGGTMSLSDFKGKYVYFDIWATWCGPCIREIPFLKEIEKKYKGKNIEIVSISVDEGRGYRGDKAAAYEGWKKMIADKDLGGIQLMADNGFNSEFIRNYKINGIPRFILVDPDGNIVSADAPRPSSPELVKLFTELGI
ncbi:thiol-disulfide isomerase/thioredoxin [Winogradskyella epiphytica]|uniref:Thiol-disulfide isomerase/thioredoxin n=1 Tax=Winogradskyella epiphytica TaxID=262005 RepID=A0A2V4WX06_9FLAO|nr:TlpA disulfide reductase family protein [Winogradskyella epiphytica]PYE81786.1 thiol-disulfide isomerase/thioredoxin [Winogradskyella epiphytica]GGW62669.1 hypothetical protein GCM10008085_13080 [Winogradskyella epiphytica]